MHTQSMNPTFEFTRITLGWLGAGTLWLADQITATPEGWLGVVKEVGLPVAMVIVLIWAYREQGKSLKESQDARIEEAKDNAKAYKELAYEQLHSRREMLHELQEQTKVMKEKP